MPRYTSKPIKRETLQDYLAKNQIRKQEFAKMLGVCPATVSVWLYTNAMPEYPTIKRIAKCFGLSVDEVTDFFATDTEQADEVPTLADSDN